MSPLELLKGKMIKVMTDMNVEVVLEVKKVEINHHSKEVEESTRANDWWPSSIDWETYTVYFTNGSTKTYNSITEIQII